MIRLRFCSIMLGVVAVFCAVSVGQDRLKYIELPKTKNAGPPLPGSSLPEHIIAPEGELTLFADYGDAPTSPVVLYLVNRTPHRIAFSAQDSDIYVKLEAETETERWERAQPHRHSGCGNSYMVFPILAPGQYFRFSGYLPSDGELRNVRYRLYREEAFVVDDKTDATDLFLHEKEFDKYPLQLVSNAGMGRIRAEDVEESRRDGFALGMGPFEVVRDLVMGMKPGESTTLSQWAVDALGSFPTEESLALVRGLLPDPDEQTGKAAMRALARMGLKSASAERLYQELLRGADVRLKANATYALTERPVTPEVVEFAKQQLSHDDLHVRVAAVSVLSSRCTYDPSIKAFSNSIYEEPDPRIQSVFETVLFPGCINYEERGYKGRFDR